MEENYYMACLWPMIDLSKLDEAESVLGECGEIVRKENVDLSYLGLKNFMIQIYEHQKWTGSIYNHFRGIQKKVDACYKEGAPVRTYLFKSDCFNAVLEAKEKIRVICKIDKSSIHISDDQSETEKMIQFLYNKNSIDFFNFANPYQYSQIYNKLKKVKQFFQKYGLDGNRFILGGDAIFELCGWQKANHYEILTDYKEDDLSGLEKLIGIDYEPQKYGCEITELLYDSQNYFFFEEMKFVTIQLVHRMKKERIYDKCDCPCL